MGEANSSEQVLSIISVAITRDETAAGLPITADRAVVSFSLDGTTIRTATFRWDRHGDDVDTADVPHPSSLWDELHDAAIEALTTEPRRLAYINHVRACEYERRRNERNPKMCAAPRHPMEFKIGDERLPPRFWCKVSPEPNSGCWLWVGAEHAGYGQYWHGGRVTGSHRVVMDVLAGIRTDGLHVDHLCKTPACCNPQHLQVVSAYINNIRSNSFSAENARITHCPHGHEYTSENTKTSRGRGRHCRTCANEQARIGSIRPVPILSVGDIVEWTAPIRGHRILIGTVCAIIEPGERPATLGASARRIRFNRRGLARPSRSYLVSIERDGGVDFLWPDSERLRRVIDLDLDAALDGGPTRRIPVETLAEVAASYYAARAVV